MSDYFKVTSWLSQSQIYLAHSIKYSFIEDKVEY